METQEKKIAGWRRPAAWIVCFLLFWIASIISELLRKGVSWAYDWLCYQETLVVILLIIFAGSTVLSIVVYSVPLIAQAIVSISEAVCPTKNAVRYYVIGGYHIINYLFSIIMAAFGVVKGDYMFFYYVFCLYMIVLSAIVMSLAKDKIGERI